MKQKLKTWYQSRPGEVALTVCLLVGIPLGLWLGRLFFHRVDEPWAVSHRNLSCTQCLVFAAILTLWLVLCHLILCVKNRRDPRSYFINQFKTSNR